MTRQIFVNLAVDNLPRTQEFFAKLGFEFNKQFTDEKAACMIINADAYVMLLARPFFQSFTKRQVCDTSTHTEALLAISCASRAAVDELVDKAIAAGGSVATDPADHGFMYYRTFYDLDGHHWEVLWMDPSAVQPQ
jgi:predicted lactoylglutathione lyase